jgi:hypothetical protein
VESAIAAPGATFTTPADGRLRGQDFVATVTGVAWPDRATLDGDAVLATPGRRFVAFNLELTEDAKAVAPDGTDPAVTAAVVYGSDSSPLSLSALNDQMAAQTLQSTWASGSTSFVLSVPNTTHKVNLVLRQGSFSQSFDLWTLHRGAPAPAVLYRSADRPTLTSSSAASTTLSMTNPADGFSGTAQVTLGNATLSYFANADAGVPPISPDQAILSVILTATYPVNLNDATVTGHYLGAQSPLPASFLSFTPQGAAPVTAAMSESGYTTGQAEDDGLFDALYSFVVPASLSSGTLAIGAGSFTGAEFTLYTAGDNTPVDITAPTTMGFAFPTVPVSAQQKRPPWIGAALPPTAAPSGGSSGGTPLTTSSNGGFPIWVAVLILLGAAGLVVALQRWRQQRGLSWSFPWPDSAKVIPATAAPTASNVVPATDIATHVVPDTAPATSAGTRDIEVGRPVTAPPSASSPPTAATSSDLTVNFLGPNEVIGWRQVPDRRIIEELLDFLVLHDARPMSAEQIRLALWPTGGSHDEVSRKTFLTYLSTLRKCIGAEHLPDAIGAGGYRITGVASDWGTFQRLAKEADAASEGEAIAFRTEALALVRGRPFEGVGSDQYEWVANEHFDTTITIAVAELALTLATDLLATGDSRASEAAARAGIKGAQDDNDLWRIGAHAIFARGDSTAMRRWLADAARHLSPADIARIEASLALHPDSGAQ